MAGAEGLWQAGPSDRSRRIGLAASPLRSGQVRRAAGDVARAAGRRALQLLEGLPALSGRLGPVEADCLAMLSSIAGLEGSGVTDSEGAVEARRAIESLRRADDDGLRAAQVRAEPALAPLAGRDDFRLLMMDLAFPAAPFADPE
jgi:hypothetical protein